MAARPDERAGRRPSSGSRGNGGRAGNAAHAAPEPWWQWLIAAVGALLVAATAGMLVYFGVTAPDGPPEISLRVERIEVAGDGYVALVQAGNHGGRTAAGLQVVGELRGTDGLVERHEFEIDYLPPDSVREGGLFFAHDPRAKGSTLRLEASGYRQP